jgi:hypothetical protein
LKKLLVMASGALLFCVPWAAFWVIPEYSRITAALGRVNATGGGIRAAVLNHYTQLRDWMNTAWPPQLPWIGKLASLPFSVLRVPPILFSATVLLYFSRSLRGLILPGAILPLFVFLAVSRKGGLYYIAPELTLYAIALFVLYFQGIDWLCRRRGWQGRVAPFSAAAFLAILALVPTMPAATKGVTRKLIDRDVARAANRAILGPDALVALNQCYDWYNAGSSRVYWIVDYGLGWNRIDRLNRRWNFDSLVLINDGFANKHDMFPFPEYYVERHLELRGFYFAGLRLGPPYDDLLSVLHLTGRPNLLREGYGFDRQRQVLNHYTEDPVGPWMFVTVKANLEAGGLPMGNAVFAQQFGMESDTGQQPRLLAFVTSRDSWVRDRVAFAAAGTIRDEVPMRMEQVSAATLLRNTRDTKITFTTDDRSDHP